MNNKKSFNSHIVLKSRGITPIKKSNSKYHKTEGVSGQNLFWDSSKKGTYKRGMK